MATRTFEAFFNTELGEAERVLTFHHDEPLGSPSEATVDVHLLDYQDPDEVIGKGAVLQYGYGAIPRRSSTASLNR